MMFLLDTNVVSELRRRRRADPNVLAWADRIDPLELFLSAVTLLELQVGALLLARRDRAQAGVLQRWITGEVLQSFAGRIVPVDEAVALRCAPLHVPDPRPERDAMIAATALENRFVLVTRNVRDFAPLNVPLLNPWEA